MADLRTAVVLDYQNMHLSGSEIFRARPLHSSLLDPSRFANQLIAARNRDEQSQDRAVLATVEVFRGRPGNLRETERYNIVQRQQANWQRDPRVTVTLRSLRYERIAAAPGAKQFRAIEKGIDVLCALALLRLARSPEIDLVILASHDSDLKPALDQAIDLGDARIETCSWFSPRLGPQFRQLRPTAPRAVWNTRLDLTDFRRAADPTDYSRRRPAGNRT